MIIEKIEVLLAIWEKESTKNVEEGLLINNYSLPPVKPDEKALKGEVLIRCFFVSVSDSTLEDILAVARTRPESVEADVVQCDDDDGDSSSSDDVSSSGGSDQNDPPPPLTAAPVLVEPETAAASLETTPASTQQLDPFAAVQVQKKPLVESDEEVSSDNENGFTFVKEVVPKEKVIHDSPLRLVLTAACLLYTSDAADE